MSDSSKLLVPACAASLGATAEDVDKLELFYFDIEGKAESIRLAAHHGGVELVDTRLTRDEFATMQETGALAYGQVPALRVGTGQSAVTLAQSAAILKFVGKRADLYPSGNDDLLAARIDALMDEEADAFCGLTVSRYPWRFGFDAAGCMGAKDRQCAVTAAVRKQLMEEVLPKHLTHLEAILAASPTGWLAGTSGPTVADFQIAPRICWAIHENDGVDPSLLDKFPKVMALVKRVYGLETVRDYYRARGKSFDNNNMKLA